MQGVSHLDRVRMRGGQDVFRRMTYDERLKRAFDLFTDRVQSEMTRQIQAAIDELAAAASAERERALHEVKEAEPAPPGKEPAPEVASERLVEAIRSLDAARSLGEILDTLTAGAAREAGRAAVLLTRGGRFRGWRFVGFDPPIEHGDTIDLSASDAGVVAEAARTGSVVAGAGAIHAGAPAFAVPGAEPTAMPLSVGGRIVAVLYADGGAPSALETMARHAARCLESMTAFKTARALVARPAQETDGGAEGEAPGTDQAAPEEDAAARRYARLLVSEIKLYHEPAVVAGRRDRDLGVRLASEIARARQLYEERVPREVRERADYFHDELVRTLAGGDASLLTRSL